MEQLPGNRDPKKGDEFLHPSGTIEIVYLTLDGKILSFREYPDAQTFSNHNGGAHYHGMNKAILDIPSPLDVNKELMRKIREEGLDNLLEELNYFIPDE